MGLLKFSGQLLFYFVICNLWNVREGYTHWIVTEDGRIQSQLDSLMSMRRPYDLMAWLQQEKRLTLIQTMRYDLLAQKDLIDKNEDRDIGLEQRFYTIDADCLAAGKKLHDFDLYISTVQPLENKGIRAEEHLNLALEPATEPKSPNCVDVMKLDFSFHAFEHLNCIKQRINLTGSPELGLKNALTYRDNIDDYGHLIWDALRKNSSSWVLYNMAAFYWRIKGEPLQTVECLRRALHLSPRRVKDVALISLANVVHRAKFSKDAAVLVHASIDISRDLNVNHFTLGNIYAVLGEYNKSVICYENTLKIQSDIEQALRRKHAVKCHAKLEKALEKQHKSLQQTLDDLKDYQANHENYQAEQERAESEQAPRDSRMTSDVVYERVRMQERAAKNGEKCEMIEKEGRLWLRCSQTTTDPHDDESPSSKYTERLNRLPATTNTAIPLEIGKIFKPTLPPKYPRVDTTEETPYFMRKEWPSKEDCANKPTYKNNGPTKYPTVYLPASNKGFNVTNYLTDAQNLGKGEEHALPWYPPICTHLAQIEDNDRSFDNYDVIRDRRAATNEKPEPRMEQQIRMLIGGEEMAVEEIGQRILTALRLGIGPPWIMYDLAGLYWRVKGNYNQAVECMRRALIFVPDDYHDVPLVNMGGLLYVWEHKIQAAELAQAAVIINMHEPLGSSLVGSLLAESGNYSGAGATYRRALELDPDLGREWIEALLEVICTGRKPVEERPSVKKQKICKKETRPIGRCDLPDQSQCPPGTLTLETCEEVDTFVKGEATTTEKKKIVRFANEEHIEQNEEDMEATLHIYLDKEQSLAVRDLYRKYELCKADACHRILFEHGLKKPAISAYYNLLMDRVIPEVTFVPEVKDQWFREGTCVMGPLMVASKACGEEHIAKKLENFATFYEKMEEIRVDVMNANAPLLCSTLVKEKGEAGRKKCVEELRRLDENVVAYVPVMPPVTNTDIPENTEHIRSRLLLPWPSLTDCRKEKLPLITGHPSVWPSMFKARIEYLHYMVQDYEAHLRFMKPYCQSVRPSAQTLHFLPSVQNPATLKLPSSDKDKYEMTLLMPTSVGEAGTHIWKSMHKNSTSWILGFMGALYWRIKENPEEAVKCLRLAINTTYNDEQKVWGYLGMAHLLHTAGKLQEAIIAASYALRVSPRDFNTHKFLANLYANMPDLDRSVLFYESALAIDSAFEEAKTNLRTLICSKILAEPKKYKKPTDEL